MRLFLALACLLGSSGCAVDSAQTDVRALAGPALASAASQVKRCYRTPRVSHSGRQIVTTLRVRMTPEGFPDGMPTVVAQHGVNAANSIFAGRMAEAAIVAVVRCAPFQFPAELYQSGWHELELTFSPLATA